MELNYFHFFEYAAFIASIVYYKGLKAFSLQLFVPLLFIVCCIETAAAYPAAFGFSTTRSFNNLYVIISPLFYFVLFYKMIRPKGKMSFLYQCFALLTMVFLIYDVVDSDFINVFNYTSFILSLTGHVILSLILLFKLAFDEEQHIRIIQHPYFWISVAILIFSLVTIVIMGLQPYIYKNQIHIFGKSAYVIIMPVICVVMYSCYAYAFYLASRTMNRYGLAGANVR